MKIRRWLPLIVLCMLFAATQAPAADRSELFFQANQAYKNANYHEAVRLYNELSTTGSVSGHIYYNLGNCYFRLGDLGRSILNYERARILIPRDADLAFNLGYARDRLHDAVEPPARPLGSIFFWLDSITLNELFILFAIINALLFTVLILRLTVRREWIFTLMVTVLVIWLIAGLSLGVKWYQDAGDNRAVIIAAETKVAAGPDVRETELFKLHAGTVVLTERKEDGWVLIRISQEKRGWVPRSAIEYISHTPKSK